jgi:hypothetical protein
MQRRNLLIFLHRNQIMSHNYMCSLRDWVHKVYPNLEDNTFLSSACYGSMFVLLAAVSLAQPWGSILSSIKGMGWSQSRKRLRLSAAREGYRTMSFLMIPSRHSSKTAEQAITIEMKQLNWCKSYLV